MADKRSITGEGLGTLAAAVAAGYLLGRTRRLKWALGIGTWYVSRRYGIRPGELAMEAGQKLLGSDDVRSLQRQMVKFGSRQARGVVSNGVSRLADSLHERTLALQEGEAGGDGSGPRPNSGGQRRPRPAGSRPRPQSRQGRPVRPQSQSRTRQRAAAGGGR